MHRNPARPMSPHLTVWKWGPHMLVSILHRVTGAGLAVVGCAILAWWLVALASGAERTPRSPTSRRAGSGSSSSSA
jgi:succinate dehydrogenase / fumarate reductase cytochrome b subunit